MHSTFKLLVGMTACTLGALLLAAGLLHLLPRLGPRGRGVSEWLCRAPGLDGVIFCFTVAPLIMGPVLAGWVGLAAAVAGQVLCVLVWVQLHELANRQAVRGPRIVTSLNRIAGRWRNHAALWIMAVAAPGFALVRLVEIVIYPPVRALVRLPSYRQGDWVNVSRQKFQGLVGHDLIWCLYCDWMTGLWSLGSEMLRNIESFWCPIRFYSGKKCANCAIDFPDVSEGWVPADGDMAQVARTIDRMHGEGDHSWFGKRVQLSVNGRPVPRHAEVLETSEMSGRDLKA